jgi:hypothetical protein
MLAEIAGRGLGVAILPESVAGSRPTQLHALAITVPGCVGESSSLGERKHRSAPPREP